MGKSVGLANCRLNTANGSHWQEHQRRGFSRNRIGKLIFMPAGGKGQCAAWDASIACLVHCIGDTAFIASALAVGIGRQRMRLLASNAHHAIDSTMLPLINNLGTGIGELELLWKCNIASASPGALA